MPTDREYFEALLVERDRRYQQRFEERDVRFQQRFDAQSEAIKAAMAAAEKSADKVERGAEQRFALLNELRGNVATKEQFEAMDKRVNAIEARLEGITGSKQGLNQGWVYLLGAVSLIATVLIIVSRIGG